MGLSESGVPRSLDADGDLGSLDRGYFRRPLVCPLPSLPQAPSSCWRDVGQIQRGQRALASALKWKSSTTLSLPSATLP